MTERRESVEERLLREARERDRDAERQRRLASPADYVYDKAQEAFWDLLDGSLHGPEAVDASIPRALWRVEVDEGDPEPPEGERRPHRGRPRRRRERMIPPSQDIRRVENDQFVESSTWWPGQPQIIRDAFIDKDGWRAAPGRRSYNTFRPAPEPRGTVAAVSVWLEHVRKLFPITEEHEHFFDICAHMMQRPEEKCNTAIVLSGTQGIGKDAALAPLKVAIGAWNTKNIDPDQLLSDYRPWLQTLLLVIDEVRATKDEFHATNFYNVLKPLIAAPPDTLPVNDKYTKLRHIVNVLRVVITTNDWMAMYIPENDRRMFIMNSPLPANWHIAEGRPDYFGQYWAWMASGGADAVGRWLLDRDLRNFNPKAPPPKTTTWAQVAASWEAGDDVVSRVLEEMGTPPIVFSSELLSVHLEAGAFDYSEELRRIVQSPRKLMHRMQAAGYSIVPKSGQRWEFKGPKGRVRATHAFVLQKLRAETDDQGVYFAALNHGAKLVGNAQKIAEITVSR